VRSTGIKSFLNHVGSSQTVGLQPGQLAPGDLPLTAEQRSQVHAAATAVSTRACPKPPANGGGHPSGSSRPSHGSGGTQGGGTGNGGGSGFGGAVGNGAGSPSATGVPSSGAPSTSTSPAAASSAALAGFGIKHSDSSADPGVILPILLAVVALLLVGGPGALLFVGARGGSRFGRFAVGQGARR
jgi:hypothetical protein